MRESDVDKLHSLGLWNGPKDFISKRLKDVYQGKRHRGFIGRFEKGTFKAYPEFDTGNNTLYLGKPRPELFELVIKRDRIRDADGNLKVIESEEELHPDYNEAYWRKQSKGFDVDAKHSSVTLTAYPLDFTKQEKIVIPSAFAGYDVQLSGAGPLGLEMGIQICKMGVDSLSIYDPEKVDVQDLAISSCRIIDPTRYRANVASEIIADQAMESVKVYRKALDVIDAGIVINTEPRYRRAVWDQVKVSQVGLYLDMYMYGLRAKIFAINPQDAKSVELYEADLANSVDDDTGIIWMVKTVAGIAAGAFQRYISSPGNRALVLDRMYTLDMSMFYTAAGCWGKA